MLDINLLKKETQLIKQKLKNRNVNINTIDFLIDSDNKLKLLMQKRQEINTIKNEKSAQIATLIKDKNKADIINKIKQEVSTLKIELETISSEITILESEISKHIDDIPNVCDDSVPIGKDETSNKELKKFLTPTKFSFTPIPHWTLGEKLKLFLPEVATKITGSRFITYIDQGARLYRALQQFTLDENIKAGFIEVLPQVIVNDVSLYSSGQLPKFKDDLFKLENCDYYLSPTAEVQLLNIHRNTIIPGESLPIKFTANTACFRSEAGSAGRDTRGVIRLHQFHKTELMCYTKPDKSYEMLEEITSQAENILELLKLPYRRIVLCTGDTGFSSSKTYDIEVWLPSYDDYKEISSCSNCIDFQARRAKIRYSENNENMLVHTLNGSSLAIDRLWVAVVENYQTEDGSIIVPEKLISYMNGIKVIKLN